MAPFVVEHVAFRAKLHAAVEAAHEWALVSVDAHVDSEVLLLSKGLAAAIEWTLEWLQSGVEIHV